MDDMYVYPGHCIELQFVVTVQIKYDEMDEIEIENGAVLSLRERIAEAFDKIHHVGSDRLEISMRDFD